MICINPYKGYAPKGMTSTAEDFALLTGIGNPIAIWNRKRVVFMPRQGIRTKKSRKETDRQAGLVFSVVK